MSGWVRVLGVAGAAVAGTLLLGMTMRHGIGITPDSVSYLATAQNWADGAGLTTYTGEPLTLFPPGLPLIVGSLAALGVAPVSAATALNLVAMALLVVGTFLLARVGLQSYWSALACAWFIAVAPATLQNMSMLWTEPLFAAVVVWLLVLLVWGVKQRQPLRVGLLVSAVVLIWLATLLRYVGIVLIVPVLLAVLLVQGTWPRRIVTASVVGLAAFTVPALIVLHNVSSGGEALGERYPGGIALPEPLFKAVELWGDYVVPGAPRVLALTLGAFVAFLMFAATIVAVRSRSAMVVVAAFVGAFWLLVWWSQANERVDTISDRLGFPALAPAVVLVAFGIVSLPRPNSREVARSLMVACWFVVAGVVSISVVSSIRDISEVPPSGLGIVRQWSAASPTMSALPSVVGAAGVASTDPWQAWWVLGRGPTVAIPSAQPAWPVSRTEADLRQLRSAVASGAVQYAVFIDNSDESVTPDRMAEWGFVLTPVADFPDGTVYSLRGPAS